MSYWTKQGEYRKIAVMDSKAVSRYYLQNPFPRNFRVNFVSGRLMANSPPAAVWKRRDLNICGTNVQWKIIELNPLYHVEFGSCIKLLFRSLDLIQYKQLQISDCQLFCLSCSPRMNDGSVAWTLRCLSPENPSVVDIDRMNLQTFTQAMLTNGILSSRTWETNIIRRRMFDRPCT